VVNGKVRLHGPKLVVFEGGAHALCLLAAGVGLVAIQVLCVVLVAAQRWKRDTEVAGEFPDPVPPTNAKFTPFPPAAKHYRAVCGFIEGMNQECDLPRIAELGNAEFNCSSGKIQKPF
jgi:hypothetical protein